MANGKADIDGLTPVARRPTPAMMQALRPDGSAELAARNAATATNAGDDGRKPDPKDFPTPSSSGNIDNGMVPNEQSEFERAKDVYDVPQQDELIDRGEGYYDKYLEGARGSGQQRANYPYQFMNHAWDNPRGNFNKASFDQTLRFSRLADMLNNRLRYVPSPNVTMGTPMTGFTQAGGATIEEWPDIETEEMRLMQANRRLDERARNAGVDLQSRIQAYPQDLQEARDKSLMGLGNEILSTENAFGRYAQNIVFSERYGGGVQQYFKKDMEKFLVDLGFSRDTRLAHYLTNVLSPWAAQTYADIVGLGAVIPEKLARFMATVRDRIWNDKNISDQDKAMAYAIYCSKIGIDAAALTSGQFGRALNPKQKRDVEDANRSLQEIRSASGARPF